jgi:hypothetical protein
MVNPNLNPEARAEALAEAAAERRIDNAHAAGLPEIGTFLATSWGYDQTNVDFYKVVGHTKSGKSCILQKWSAKRDPSSVGSCDYLGPGDGPAQVAVWEDIPEAEREASGTPWIDWIDKRRTGEYEDVPTFVHRARWHGDSTTVHGHYAKIYDGVPVYATAPGWGH